METKRFEDLEFQQLERESRQDEEKETQTQQILREIAEFQRCTVTRKVGYLFAYAHTLIDTIRVQVGSDDCGKIRWLTKYCKIKMCDVIRKGSWP